MKWNGTFRPATISKVTTRHTVMVPRPRNPTDDRIPEGETCRCNKIIGHPIPSWAEVARPQTRAPGKQSRQRPQGRRVRGVPCPRELPEERSTKPNGAYTRQWNIT